jgi:hypothetical protein
MRTNQQTTLKTSVTLTGIGVHSGCERWQSSTGRAFCRSGSVYSCGNQAGQITDSYDLLQPRFRHELVKTLIRKCFLKIVAKPWL